MGRSRVSVRAAWSTPLERRCPPSNSGLAVGQQSRVFEGVLPKTSAGADRKLVPARNRNSSGERSGFIGADAWAGDDGTAGRQGLGPGPSVARSDIEPLSPSSAPAI